MELRSVEAIVRALNAARVQYVIVGGLAVNAHGFERLTRDVDIVIGLEEQNIIRGLRTLMDIGYNPAVPISPEEFADPVRRDQWRRDKNMVVLKLWSDLHRRTPVDIFTYEPFDFRKEFADAVWLNVASDVEAPILQCETLLQMKRETGRAQDLLDVQEIEAAQKLKQGDD